MRKPKSEILIPPVPGTHELGESPIPRHLPPEWNSGRVENGKKLICIRARSLASKGNIISRTCAPLLSRAEGVQTMA